MSIIRARNREKSGEIETLAWPKITDRASPKSRKNVWETGRGEGGSGSRGVSGVSSSRE